jgi:hypothetical protein
MKEVFLVAEHVQWNMDEYRLDNMHRHNEKRHWEGSAFITPPLSEAGSAALVFPSSHYWLIREQL